MSDDWVWDPSLYAGSARYYALGRLPYPPFVADVLRDVLALDGTGRLLDVGCGPGALTLVLAGLFSEAVGVDADGAMLAEAARLAHERQCGNVRWVRLLAEELPAGLGRFRVATLAQSFHWMDRPRVASLLARMLGRGGPLAHVAATTDRGVAGGGELPGPRPPRDRVQQLIAAYLGPVPRAGQGLRRVGSPPCDDEVFTAAGFAGPRRLSVGGGQVFCRTEDEIVASVFSLSSAAPHLFGDRLGEFERDLRRELRHASPAGQFWEKTRAILLSIWTAA